MSLEQQADFKITATWEDNASQPLIRSTEKINLAWKNLRREQLAVRREFEINNRTLLATSRVVSTVTGVVSRGIQVFQTYTLMQIRAQDATRNLREEQRQLNDIIAEFGVDSKEYRDQLQKTKEAEDELAQTTKDNFIGTLLNAALVIGVVTSAVIRVIPRLREFKAAVKGISVPTKTPVPTTTTKGTGILSKIFKGAQNLGKKLPLTGIAGGVAGAALYLSQLAGEQTAASPLSDVQGNEIAQPELPGGIGQLEKIGRDIIVTINNFINSPTPDQMAQDITDATNRSLTFTAN